jgi:hypothetical protein
MKRFSIMDYIDYSEKKLLLLILKNQFKIMAKQEQFDELLTRLDAATTEIASDLQALRDELAAGTINDASLATLDAKIAQLEAMGADPADPIPTDPIEPPIDEPV